MLWSWAPQRGSASTLLSSWGAQEARLDASLCANGEWVADGLPGAERTTCRAPNTQEEALGSRVLSWREGREGRVA